jgi:hypothetical protein
LILLAPTTERPYSYSELVFLEPALKAINSIGGTLKSIEMRLSLPASEAEDTSTAEAVEELIRHEFDAQE